MLEVSVGPVHPSVVKIDPGHWDAEKCCLCGDGGVSLTSIHPYHSCLAREIYVQSTRLDLQLAYECSHVSLEQLHSKWRDVLNVGRESEDSVAVKHLESAVGLYLKRVCCNHDTTDIVEVRQYFLGVFTCAIAIYSSHYWMGTYIM